MTWEAVHEFDGDRGRILYWRYVVDGRDVGAYSRKPDGWRALMYRPHRTPRELGRFRDWRQARRAVQREAAAELAAAAKTPEQVAEIERLRTDRRLP